MEDKDHGVIIKDEDVAIGGEETSEED
ncbi:hypothetical protein ARAM_007672 [Aspergillus rambellii]|uniref:Uncharacterized protein n=1 Tax=Aspergillus rambellii TaxID=308745 RepID=A0A0F8UDB5_9EURO|nr:hypothetical protein ARAM_007672 [Aspergillus rambellii]